MSELVAGAASLGTGASVAFHTPPVSVSIKPSGWLPALSFLYPPTAMHEPLAGQAVS